MSKNNGQVVTNNDQGNEPEVNNNVPQPEPEKNNDQKNNEETGEKKPGLFKKIGGAIGSGAAKVSNWCDEHHVKDKAVGAVFGAGAAVAGIFTVVNIMANKEADSEDDSVADVTEESEEV